MYWRWCWDWDWHWNMLMQKLTVKIYNKKGKRLNVQLTIHSPTITIYSKSQ